MTTSGPSVRPSRGRRLVRALTVAAVMLVVTSAGYLTLVDVRSRAMLILPTPSGRFHVGRVQATVTDPTRAERPLSVWAWYPALRGTAPSAVYLPGAWAGLQIGLPLGQTRLDRVRDAAYQSAEPAAGRFPVVVLLPGLGFAAPQYAVVAEEIASRGYVVLGVTPTGSANLTVVHGKAVTATGQGNPSGFGGDHTPHDEAVAAQLMPTWIDDTRAAVAALGALPAPGGLASHAVTDEVAYVGHSFGGTVALQACHDDPHCTDAVDLDGGIFGTVATAGLDVPTLLVGHDGSCVTGRCRAQDPTDQADARAATTFIDASSGSVRTIDVRHTGHCRSATTAPTTWPCRCGSCWASPIRTADERSGRSLS